MFGKQPRNVSSRSSTSSTSTSLTRRLNITDGSKLPPGSHKPATQAVSTPTVATSPVTAEGSLTMPKEGSTDAYSQTEGKRKVWAGSQMFETSPLSSHPLERAPVFVAPPSNVPQPHTLRSHHDDNTLANTAFEVDANSSTLETESLSTPRPSQFTRRGMENGYSLSPMYNLWLEYCNEGESTKSTQSRVVYYATKPSLARDEVVDRGSKNPTQRYRVHESLFEQVSSTVNELQVFIQHMAGMIEERKTYFHVDPDNTLLKVLEGAEMTSQLHAAWTGLTNQLVAVQRFMLKYQHEYQNNSVPPSPVSTNLDIHNYIVGLPDVDDKLRSIHGSIPHHADKLSQDARQRLTVTKGKWEKIIPAPPWLASSPTADIPARTSYKVASSFTLPDIVEPTEVVQKKQVSAISTPWKGSKVVQFAPPMDNTESPQPSAPMSSGTPFKSAKGLFSQEEGQDLGPFPQTGPNRHTSANNFLYGTDDVRLVATTFIT